jgi:tetratricopeptide (TPR) repeat protein
MKRVILVGVLLSLAGVAAAQSGKKFLNDAYDAYSRGYYEKAKTAIDKCIEFDDTKADAKAWLYRGNIYLTIEDAKMGKDSLKYKHLCDNCAEIAYESYMKSNGIDPNFKMSGGMVIHSAQQGLEYCAIMLFNSAYAAMEEESSKEKASERNYEPMYQLAKKAVTANSKNAEAVYCLGLASFLTNRKDEAKANYHKLVGGKYERSMYPYTSLANIYQEENDTVRAIKVMQDGVSVFLRDTAFDVKYAEAYSVVMSWAGKGEEAAEMMNKALAKDPTNYTMLTNYGSALVNNKKYDEAEGYLRRAVEIEPNAAIANYNLGHCYLQVALNKTTEVNGLPANASEELYDKLKAEEKVLYEKARPYVEKAHELDPNDEDTLKMLRQIYMRIGASAEEKTIIEKLNALKKKE